MSTLKLSNSTITPTYGSSTPINAQIYWDHSIFPWNRPGYSTSNITHIGCLASDAAVQDACCKELNGTYVESLGAATGNKTAGNGALNWCELKSDGVGYNNPYISAPASVGAWAGCYAKQVPAARNPGGYRSNVTTSSIIYECEVGGNFTGSASFGLPMLTAPTSGGSKVGYKTGLLAVLLLSGVVSLGL